MWNNWTFIDTKPTIIDTTYNYIYGNDHHHQSHTPPLEQNIPKSTSPNLEEAEHVMNDNEQNTLPQTIYENLENGSFETLPEEKQVEQKQETIDIDVLKSSKLPIVYQETPKFTNEYLIIKRLDKLLHENKLIHAKLQEYEIKSMFLLGLFVCMCLYKL